MLDAQDKSAAFLESSVKKFKIFIASLKIERETLHGDSKIYRT